MTACSTEDEQCGQFAKCNVRDPLWRIKDRILAALRPARWPRSRPRRRLDEPVDARVAHARSVATVGELVVTASPSISTTTRPRPWIRGCSQAMLPYFTEQFGNPAQQAARLRLGGARRRRHGARAGRGAHQRERRARSCSPAARPSPTTSRSRASRRRACATRGDHIVTVATEHKSVLDVVRSVSGSRAAR